jgi:UDP-glucose 4-epimerase
MPRFAVIDFLRKLQADPTRLEVLGNGKQVRDFNYVSDTVSGLLTLASSGTSGQAYNLASGVSYNVTELAQKLLLILGLRDTTSIEYTGSSWVGDAQRWEVDVTKIRDIGHTTEVNLEEGLRRVVDWFGFESS